MLLGSLSNVTSFQLQGFPPMAALKSKKIDDVPIFHNLRTLSLEACSTNIIRSDVHEFKAVGRFLQKSPNLEKLTLKRFKILLHCLRNSPNLEKLNIWRCKLSDDSMGEKGKAKSKKTYSPSRKLARFQCLKLEYAEILRGKEDAGVPELVSFLLAFAASTITVKVTSI